MIDRKLMVSLLVAPAAYLAATGSSYG